MRPWLIVALVLSLAGCVPPVDRKAAELCKVLTPERARQLIGPGATQLVNSYDECSYVNRELGFSVRVWNVLDPEKDEFEQGRAVAGDPERVTGVGADAYWRASLAILTTRTFDIKIDVRIVNEKSPDKAVALEQTKQLALDLLPETCENPKTCQWARPGR